MKNQEETETEKQADTTQNPALEQNSEIQKDQIEFNQVKDKLIVILACGGIIMWIWTMIGLYLIRLGYSEKILFIGEIVLLYLVVRKAWKPFKEYCKIVGRA